MCGFAIDVMQRAIQKYGNDSQLKMLLEEMSELQKEICKHWRGKNNVEDIVSEMADVHIMLEQLRIIMGIGIDELNNACVNKLERLNMRLESEEE